MNSDMELALKYISEELNIKLNTTESFFSVTLEFVPYSKTWWIMTNIQPYINYEVISLDELESKDNIDKIIKELVVQIREFFKEKGIDE